MASLEKRNQTYRIAFRLDGKRFSRSLETQSIDSANLALARVKDGLARIKQGILTIDPEEDLLTVVLSEGQSFRRQTVHKAISVGELLDNYLASIPEASIEPESFGMLRIHVRNLKSVNGGRKVRRLAGI